MCMRAAGARAESGCDCNQVTTKCRVTNQGRRVEGHGHEYLEVTGATDLSAVRAVPKNGEWSFMLFLWRRNIAGGRLGGRSHAFCSFMICSVAGSRLISSHPVCCSF